MRVFFEADQRLKIELDSLDMHELEITYDELDGASEKTRRVMNELLCRIGAENDFSPRDGKIIIEVFPTDNEGCVIYFTVLKNEALKARKRHSLLSVFEVEGIDGVFEIAERLKSRGSQQKISLYQFENRYRLEASNIKSGDELIISEFADRLKRAAALNFERWKLLSDDVITDMG